MPPPPAGLLTKTKAGSASGSNGASRASASNFRGLLQNTGDTKGKGKEIVIEVDDDDDIAFTGSTPGTSIRSESWILHASESSIHC